ncbi:MAG: radical SAM protein [Methanomicrobiales archaeon]|jgi:biotin synthase-related radical SAM superfamily protein|nr:radical SAM protein [Methanomicrobiales archaeon]
MWINTKADLLAAGTAQISGASWHQFVSQSIAGPGAGGDGAVFLNYHGHRVKLSLSKTGSVLLSHRGGGVVSFTLHNEQHIAKLEPASLHCPEQAYITISGSCIFSCKYCNVPSLAGRRKSNDEIVHMIQKQQEYGSVRAISLTSGIMHSVEEEEENTVSVVTRLRDEFPELPIGVSIYPTEKSAMRLYEAGACEVKFNLEAATADILAKFCPESNRDVLLFALAASVPLFGKGHVFSNVILGLGESDQEMEACIYELCDLGVIPIIRPLSPHAELEAEGYHRPDSKRLLAMHEIMTKALGSAELDPSLCKTMCPRCGGCDLVVGRDS